MKNVEFKVGEFVTHAMFMPSIVQTTESPKEIQENFYSYSRQVRRLVFECDSLSFEQTHALMSLIDNAVAFGSTYLRNI